MNTRKPRALELNGASAGVGAWCGQVDDVGRTTAGMIWAWAMDSELEPRTAGGWSRLPTVAVVA